MNLLQMKNVFVEKEYTPSEEDLCTIIALHQELRCAYTTKNKTLAVNAFTVRDLFWQQSFKEVFSFIVSNEWAEPTQEDVYASIYKTILKQPVDTSIQRFLVVAPHEDGPPDVYEMKWDDCTHFAFDFVSYRELANYLVHPRCLATYQNNLELIAGILEEFSWNPHEEQKEETQAELNELATSAHEHFEKIKEKEAIETAIEGVENAHNLWESDNDEEAGMTFRTLKKNEGVFLKDIFHHATFSAYYDHFVTHCLEHYEYDLKVPPSQLSTLFTTAFFQIKKALTSAEKVNRTLVFEMSSDFAYFYEGEEHTLTSMKCMVNGSAIMDYVGYTVTDRFGLLDEIDLITQFLFVYLAPSLTWDKNRCKFQDEFQWLKTTLQNKKTMMAIFDNLERGVYKQYRDLSIDEIELLLQRTNRFIQEEETK